MSLQKLQEILNSKKPFCKHDDGCLASAILQALKNVKHGLVISTVLQIVRSARALAKGSEHFFKSFDKEIFSIIIFLSLSTLTLRLIKCGIRWIRNKDDKLSSFVAGIGAGLVGIKTLNKKYWYILLMFMASRVAVTIHQTLIQKKVLRQKDVELHYYLLFTFAHVVNSYGYFIEPDILKPDMYNLYEKMSVLTPQEKKWHLSSLEYTYRSLKEQKKQFHSDFLLKKIQKLRAQIQK